MPCLKALKSFIKKKAHKGFKCLFSANWANSSKIENG